jgi:hypothetical protein
MDKLKEILNDVELWLLNHGVKRPRALMALVGGSLLLLLFIIGSQGA